MITHHPEAELLLDYAAGGLALPVSMVVASHACLCADCRKQVGRLEAIGGAYLQGLEPSAVREDLLAATLAELEDAEKDWPEPKSSRENFDEATRVLVPAPARPFLPGNVDDLKWRWRGPALREARLAVGNAGFRSSLFRLGPGSSPPEHGHSGNEYTLVLAGSFLEEGDIFRAGDFVHYDRSDTHLQIADDRDGCVCLTVLDAPVHLTGPVGRLLNPFLRF